MLALLILVTTAFAAGPEDEVVAAFTPRHAPSCAEIAPDRPEADRVRAFVAVAERVSVPPWVPVLAAACAAESARDPVARAAVARWIDDPSRAGLAVAALGRLDALPEAAAADLADRAVLRARADARFAEWVRAPLAASSHAAVRLSAERLGP